MKRPTIITICLLSALCLLQQPSLAQGGIPLPGGGSGGSSTSSYSPTPGGAPSPGPEHIPSAPRANTVAAPIPGAVSQQALSGPGGIYRRLPLNYQNAAVRLEELRNIMVNSKPKEFQDAISDYLDWLADMADAHWKIYQAFSKVDTMKAQADLEKQSTLKLGQLKRQAMLLKAEFLIRENRQPEALQPLVDIVVAEPKTATGEAAYAMLKQIGFSDEVSLNLNQNSNSTSTSRSLSVAPQMPALAPSYPISAKKLFVAGSNKTH